MKTMRVAFIGLGVMGRSMAGHLLAAGHAVTVYTRTRSTAGDLLAHGAVWAESPAEAAREAQVAITMVGYPSDVEEVYLGSQGIFAGLASGGVAIDMTTSDPQLARQLGEEGARRGIEVLDAPVSGGDSGAREARLSIMVGGSESGYQRSLPLLQLMGQNVVRQGDWGAGQYCKLCNQIVIAGGMVAIAEALGFAAKAGLDMDRVMQSISAGAAGSWSLSNMAPRALRGDLAPGFYVKHFIKDLGIAIDSAEAMGLDLPGLALAKRCYDDLAQDGGGSLGTQALLTRFMERE